MPLLSVRNLSKTFSGQQVLTDVDLQLDEGKIHALLGENGSGKSTLIKCLAGYYSPDPGAEVIVAGHPLTLGSPAESMRLGMRFVHQTLGLVDEMSVDDNLNLTADASRKTFSRKPTVGSSAGQTILDRIGVPIRPLAKVADLTPLQRAAVAIARALDDSGGAPRLLVLDEPTSAMSPGETDDLFRVLRSVASRGTAVMYVSHRLDEVMQLCSVATILRDGQRRGTVDLTASTRRSIIELITGFAMDEEERDRPSLSTGPTNVDGRNEPPVLTIVNAHSAYVRGINLAVRKGEVVGVAGLDGSGRDVLGAMLAGVYPAEMELTTSRGKAESVRSAAHAARLGVAVAVSIASPASAISEMTVSENITLTTLNKTASRFGRLLRGKELLTTEKWIRNLDIRPPQPAKQLQQLSGGNRQKVIIARALECEPDVLVLVDPTAGVDVGARQAIYNILRRQASSGLGILICSSDLEDLATMCSRVLCLVRGSIVAELQDLDITEGRILEEIVKINN